MVVISLYLSTIADRDEKKWRICMKKAANLVENTTFYPQEIKEWQIVADWLELVQPYAYKKEEREFFARVKEALKRVNADFYIGVVPVPVSLSLSAWKTMVLEADCVYPVRFASRWEVTLYDAYRIASGELTLAYVTGEAPSAKEREAKRIAWDDDGPVLFGGGGNRFTAARLPIGTMGELSDESVCIEGAVAMLSFVE